MKAVRFIPGRIYRRSELHDQFGGNRQKGFQLPLARTSPCSSRVKGSRFGYPDKAIGADAFEYPGKASLAICLTVGNQAIIDRIPKLHMFKNPRRPAM